MMRAFARYAAITALLLSAAEPVAAVPETEAASLWLEQNGRPGIVAAGHYPAEVKAGTQWEGYIRLADNVTFETVRFQICIVGSTCFAPPTPAETVEEGIWRFNTTDYQAVGSRQPIDWQAGWHVGVRYVIEDRHVNGTLRTTVFPQSQNLTSVGSESHYLTLDIQGDETVDAPLPSAGLLGVSIMGGIALTRWRRSR